MRRICLFAGHNHKNEILDYVVRYIKELSKYADIYYMSDDKFDGIDFSKIKQYVKGAWVLDHKKYDFGSYSELAKKYVGWDEIEKYDELILANDSCICVQSFDKVFEKMSEFSYDAWSLTATDERNLHNIYSTQYFINHKELHSEYFTLNSNFVVLGKNVIKDENFRTFLNNVKVEKSREDVCMHYEMGLTRFLEDANYYIGTFIDRVYPEVYIYNYRAFLLLKDGLPIIKAKIFTGDTVWIADINNFIAMIEKNFEPNIRKYLKQIDKFILLKEKVRNFCKYPRKRLVKRLPLVNKLKIAHLKLKTYSREKEFRGFKPSDIPNYKTIQKRLIEKYKKSNNIVLYFSVARDLIGGGLLSINRFVEHSKILSESMGFDLVLCGIPLFNAAIRHSMFKDAIEMVDFEMLSNSVSPDNLLINIPEAFLKEFNGSLSHKQKLWLKGIKNLRINILNQNIDFMPSTFVFNKLFDYTNNVSITCAHAKYCTKELADKYCCPVYLLPPFLPEFPQKTFHEKENIIVISPDNDIPSDCGISKENILQKLREGLPDFELVEINNISIDEYIDLIAKAKFAITFGEGYDGYFVEPYLTGSVSFAVYNNEFFPKEFEDCSTVYQNWNILYENIIADIKNLNSNSELYESTQKNVKNKIKKYTSNNLSAKYLSDFYAQRPTFLPSER